MIRYGVEGFDSNFFDYGYFDIFVIILLVPIVEEFLFRGYLSGRKDQLVFIVPQMIFCLIILKNFILYVLILYLIFGVIFYLNIYKHLNEKAISNFLIFLLCFFSSILFSVVHYSNISHDSEKISILLSVICYFPGALFLSFVRYKGGLFLSIFLHILINVSILFINNLVY
ncbi:type II CAAX prenyl endopeptidase Rce1 family protein [Algoriphagus halophilus]|uniref:CPBP family glutamic-type intramembrane protease n=1 Tax=Algoriphagus halophilus TaxID=226505 RepID=UPI00358E496A